MPTTLRTPRLFTVSEYHTMVRTGVLDENDRVELIRGQIISMAAIGSRHASCVNHLTELFILRVRPHAMVHIQNPIRLSRHSEPEPDLALLARKEVYAARHPGPNEILLVVEIADTTLDFDRRIKIPLYGEAGLREFWIVNLVDECLEVYRRPGPGGYDEATTLHRGDEVAIQALPDAGAFSVEEILGP